METGCCIDKSCTAETCMRLPAGKKCGACIHFDRCVGLFGCHSFSQTCDFFPRRFEEKAPDARDARISELEAALGEEKERICQLLEERAKQQDELGLKYCGSADTIRGLQKNLAAAEARADIAETVANQRKDVLRSVESELVRLRQELDEGHAQERKATAAMVYLAGKLSALTPGKWSPEWIQEAFEATAALAAKEG